MNTIVKWIMANYFIDAVKHIEKQNLMTKVLEACFKQKILKESWGKFIDGVIRLLNDAKTEAEEARRWT